MEKDWATLKAAAHKIANDLHTSPFRTLVHGDAKTANFLFGKDAKGNLAAAAYDFQYTGGGDGMKDIAYLITSSVQQRLLPDKEEELLRYYYERLKLRLSSSQVEVYTWEVAQERYSLAVADFVRFMAGWGWWGATGYAEKKTRAFIQRNYSCDVQA
jgi:aminoglycoside phosphotransferase (APT) family kinase protein